jgi:LacI family transcriptional regulator
VVVLVTIKDVARAANISVTTVSRALNGYSDVNVDTKARIHRIAKEMGYVPNRAAQNLVKTHSSTLAIILSGLTQDGGKDNIVYRLLAGMYQFAETVNYEVALFTTSSAHQKEKSYVQFCREHNIAGAVLNGIRLDDPYLMELVNSELPCVLIDVNEKGEHVSSVSVDNRWASEEIVSLLLSHGHTEIGMVTGRKEAQVSIDREAGYKKALMGAGVCVNPEYTVVGDFLEEKAYLESKELLQKFPQLTAIFCASDMMSIGVYRAAKELGRLIPKDLSVVGFDDIPIAEHLSPPLTTVGQDFYRMGYEAAKQLLSMIHGEVGNKNVVLSHKVLVRDSVFTL